MASSTLMKKEINNTTAPRESTMEIIRSQMKWLVLSRKLELIRKKLQMMRSSLPIVLLFSKWKRRRLGKRFRRRSAKQSRSCKLDKEMKRTECVKSNSEWLKRLRRKKEWGSIRKKEMLAEQRLRNKIRLNNTSNIPRLIIVKQSQWKTRRWSGGRKKRNTWRTRQLRRWYGSRRWTRVIGNKW